MYVVCIDDELGTGVEDTIDVYQSEYETWRGAVTVFGDTFEVRTDGDDGDAFSVEHGDGGWTWCREIQLIWRGEDLFEDAAEDGDDVCTGLGFGRGTLQHSIT